MTDIHTHLASMEQALLEVASAETAQSLSEASDNLKATVVSIMDYACAAADDDLLQCAEQAESWIAELSVEDAEASAAAIEQLQSMVRALFTAYEPPTGLPRASDDTRTAAENDASELAGGAPPASVDIAFEGDANVDHQLPMPGQLHVTDQEPRDPEILAEFLAESSEHLVEAEQHLLALDGDPSNQQAIAALFRGFHTIKGLAGFLDFPAIEVLAHAAEDVLTVARDDKTPLPAGAPDVILEAVDRLHKSMQAIRNATAENSSPSIPPQINNDLVERLNEISEHHADARRRQHSLEAKRSLTISSPPTLAPSASDQDDESDNKESGESIGTAQHARSTQRDTIRIDAERLERLVDMVGELVITESMVARSIESFAITVPGLGRHLTRMDKITRELHELAGSLRMVPVRSTFRKMARLARDVARKSGKNVSFRVLGEEAELDKTLVDRIGDPLVHMVRNAIDHGLEASEQDRTRAGKDPVGQVVLRALHRGGTVHIEVEDDGRGLNPEKIRARAIERGLIRETEALTEAEITRLICEPGFSTAERVTSISGRGVGMDVVRQHIESMNGTLSVTSKEGQGTCFSMQLPLTLAVIDGMVMRLGEERYVVPTLSVVRLVQPTSAQLHSVLNRDEVIHLGEEVIPVVRPEVLFKKRSSEAEGRLAVVVEIDRGKVAMLVDELLGQQQVVIKSLGEGLGDIPGIAGCAIMPDGRVGLVLDVAGLIRGHQVSQNNELRQAS